MGCYQALFNQPVCRRGDLSLSSLGMRLHSGHAPGLQQARPRWYPPPIPAGLARVVLVVDGFPGQAVEQLFSALLQVGGTHVFVGLGEESHGVDDFTKHHQGPSSSSRKNRPRTVSTGSVRLLRAKVTWTSAESRSLVVKISARSFMKRQGEPTCEVPVSATVGG